MSMARTLRLPPEYCLEGHFADGEVCGSEVVSVFAFIEKWRHIMGDCEISIDPTASYAGLVHDTGAVLAVAHSESFDVYRDVWLTNTEPEAGAI